MEEKNDYVAIWDSYESFFEQYDDEQVGRLVRAMMNYKWFGIKPEFNGDERFIWPAIKRDLDAAIARQAKESQKNRENGSKGGRPKKATASNDEPENQSIFEETEKTDRFSEKPKKATVFFENPKKPKEKEREIEKETEKGKENTADACAEPASGSPPVICLPLNDGTEYPIFHEACQEWAALYPAVDVMQQLREMRGWLLANRAKRKTRRGILQFITRWLAREQDKGPRRDEYGPSAGSSTLGSPGAAMDDLRELHQLFAEEDSS